MQNKKLMILIILGAFAVISLIYGMVTPSKKRRERLSKPVYTQDENKITATKRIVSTVRGVKRSNYPSWGRSPFIPLVSGNKTVVGQADWSFINPKLPGLKIEGILFDKTNPLAIINDKIVAIGDSISDCKIVSITMEEIVIRYMDKEYSVKISGDKL